MTRDQLLERANRWTTSRYGVRVTKRMLEDWVHEELVPGPRRESNAGRRAARWEWSAASYAGLLRVCRAKFRGAATFDQLRIYLWLRSTEPISYAVRVSMQREHRRLYRRVYRSLRNDAGPTSSERGRSSHRRVRFVERNREDERLKPFADQIPIGVRTMLYDAARFGVAFDTTPMIEILATLFPGLAPGAALPDECALDLSGSAEIAEDDDDPLPESAEQSIAILGAGHFDRARRIVWFLGRVCLAAPRLAKMYFPTLVPVAQSFRVAGSNIARHHPWNFVVFVMFLHGTRKIAGAAEVIGQSEVFLEHALNGSLPHASFSRPLR